MTRGLAAAALVGAALALGGAPAAARPGRAVRVEHRPADAAPAVGPRAALVTVELFFTPGAGGGHSAYLAVLELQRRHPTRVRVVFRPLPRNQNLPAIAVAAHQRGQFFELMNALAAGPATPSPAASLALAVKIGLARALAERAPYDDAVLEVLERNRSRAFRLGTTSNPEVVFNGQPAGRRIHAGSVTVAELENEYRAALDDARRAEAQGVPRRALAALGAQRQVCGDEPEPEASDDDRPGGAPPEPPGPPEPAFAWRLGRLLTAGTGCPVARHLPATLDEVDRDELPVRDPVPLLAAPLPTTGVPGFGPTDAPVPIFVVCNLRGRYCLDQLDLARRVAEHHPGQVRVIWVPWVEEVGDGADRDLTLAQAALCATAAGDGWGFLRAVTTAGVPTRGRIDLAALAVAAGLDADELTTCAAGETTAARAAAAAARASGIDRTPTVVVGGRAYLGGFGDDRRLAEHIAAELAPGLLESLAPTW